MKEYYRLERKLDKDAQENNESAHEKKKKQEQCMEQYRANNVSDVRKELHNKYKKKVQSRCKTNAKL